jgi:hypothetical protein
VISQMMTTKKPTSSSAPGARSVTWAAGVPSSSVAKNAIKPTAAPLTNNHAARDASVASLPALFRRASLAIPA